MSVLASVALGAVAPQAFVMNITPGSSGLDLTTVTAYVFNVRRPLDRTTTTWTAVASNVTSATMTLTHTYMPNDLNQIGVFQVYATLTSPAGSLPTTSVQLTVFDPYLG